MVAKRNGGTEILRIIAMLMIISHHFAVHGGIEYHSQFTMNNIFVNAMEFGGKLGVNIFVLITGYYSYKSKFSSSKILKLISSAVFYSIILTIVSVLVGAVVFRKKLLLQASFPMFLGQNYWFVSIYIILYCLTPLLNAGINSISKNMHKFILLTLLSAYCFLPNTIGLVFKTFDYGISTTIWFVTIYLLGAYLKKYPAKFLENKIITTTYMFLSIITILIGTTLNLYIESSGINNRWLNIVGRIIGDTGLYDIMPLFVALFMFLVFKNLNLNTPNWIMCIASSTFGIYLIHDNGVFRTYLWNDICKLTTMVNKPYFIPYSILCVILIFTICAMIEILRQKYIESKFFSIPLVKKATNKIDEFVKR